MFAQLSQKRSCHILSAAQSDVSIYLDLYDSLINYGRRKKYDRPLYFRPVVSSFFLSFFLSFFSPRNSNGHISVLHDAAVTWLGMLVVLHVLCCVCWCDLDPIQGQGQGQGAFELPTIAHNCTFLLLSPPPFSRAAQNWWSIMIV